MAPRKVSLSINGAPVEIVDFVQELISSVVTGILSTLKGVNEIRSLELSFQDDYIEIKVNNNIVPSNDFVNMFIRNTVNGMVSSLKGIERIDRLEIEIGD
jgi:hypothetical protein